MVSGKNSLTMPTSKTLLKYDFEENYKNINKKYFQNIVLLLTISIKLQILFLYLVNYKSAMVDQLLNIGRGALYGICTFSPLS